MAAGLVASIFSGVVAYVDLVLGDEQLGNLMFNLDWVIGTMTAWCRSHRAKRGRYIGFIDHEGTILFTRSLWCGWGKQTVRHARRCSRLSSSRPT